MVLIPNDQQATNALQRITLIYREEFHRPFGIFTAPTDGPSIPSGVRDIALDIRAVSVWFGSRYLHYFNLHAGDHERAIRAVERDLRATDEWRRENPAPAPDPIVTPPERGRLRLDGLVFRDEDGAIWTWRGATMFLLFYRFLLGQDITPHLQWMRRRSVNVARVFAQVGWRRITNRPGESDLGDIDFRPERWGADYINRLHDFFGVLGSHGLRCEFTVFTGARENQSGDSEQQRRFLRQVYDVAGEYWNNFTEIGNEPHVNSLDTVALSHGVPRRGVLTALGDYDIRGTSLPVADYVTFHTPRDYDWPRRAKDLLEMRDGGVVGPPPYPGAQRPVVGDEPYGVAWYDREGSGARSTNLADHFQHHAVGMLFCAGMTLHSQSGLEGRAPEDGGLEDQCAALLQQARAIIPPDTQVWQYTRGGLNDFPLAWQADDTSRSYGRVSHDGRRAFVVAVRPRPSWQPQAIHDWRIVTAVGPHESLVVLER